MAIIASIPLTKIHEETSPVHVRLPRQGGGTERGPPDPPTQEAVGAVKAGITTVAEPTPAQIFSFLIIAGLIKDCGVPPLFVSRWGPKDLHL